MICTARRLAVVTLFSLPALLPLVGCGRAEYEAEVNQAIGRLKIDNQFRMLEAVPSMLAAWKGEQGPTGTKVTFRKPSLYNAPPFNATTMNPRNQQEAMPGKRLKPPFLQDFPGYSQTWEKSPVTGRNDSTAYLYVGAQAPEEGIEQRMLEEIKAAFPDLPELQWGDIQLITPEGRTVKSRILSFDHEQEYWHLSDQEPIKIGSTALFLVRTEQGRQIIIAARWSNMAGDLHQRRQEVLSSAGTVQVALGTKIE